MTTALGIISATSATAPCSRNPLRFLLPSRNSLCHRGTRDIVYEGKTPAGIVTVNEEAMDRMVDGIQKHGAKHPEFHFQRNTIYLRFCHRDYHKGAALGELCRLEGIDRDSVFAAGDHYNDISMLDGTYAAMTACPSNAIQEIKDVVVRSQGYVAGLAGGDGIAEAIEYFQKKATAPRSRGLIKGRLMFVKYQAPALRR